jgi:glucokinase
MNNYQSGTPVLAGDIGGTKINLGLFVPGKRRPRPQVTETYSSMEAHDLEDILQRFLEEHPVSVTSACFGIAGPVVNGRCKTTNLPWEVSEARIQKRFGWPRVRLINDLAATALATPLLYGRELFPLNSVRIRKGSPLGVVAPGTGLGQALAVFHGDRHIPISSEGGHVDFAPNTPEEIHLLQYLSKRYGHVSIERVVSGSGLVNIYAWLKDSGRHHEPGWLNKLMTQEDPAKVISEHALNDRPPLCVAALDMFVTILGAVSGNLALTAVTRGGIYLGGGIPPKILPKLTEGLFMKAFTNKGRFKELLEKIPVRVILNDKAALLGAAHGALENKP